MIAAVAMDAEPATAARLSCFKSLENIEGARVALLVAHAPAGRVKPNVPTYCAALRRAGLNVVLIAASNEPFVGDPALVEMLSGGFARENKGYDFAAWAHLLKAEPKLWSAAILFLLNDSVIGPLSQNRLDDLIDRITKNPADVMGATENFDFEWHLQSYFLAFKRRAIASAAFRSFFDQVRNLPNKDAVIQTYEVRLTRILSQGGLTCAPTYRSRDKGNPTLGHWRDLVDAGFPFVKTELLRGLNPNWNIDGWRETLAVAGFDPAVAAATIAATDAAAAYGSSAEKRSLRPVPKQKATLVLGMHRSGTSAVAGVISRLGAASPKTPLVPQNDNPRGFFESAALVATHDELLAAIDSRWDDWRRLDPRRVDAQAGRHRQAIKQVLIDEYGDEPLIFIKDPRICRFVPFTLSILADLNVSPVAVLPIRNPLEVAHSLKRRDNFSLPKSIMMWLRHVLDAEYHTRDLPRYFLPYEGLLQDWRHQVDCITEKTSVAWPGRSGRSSAEVDEFLTRELYHEQATPDETEAHPEVSQLARETYRTLLEICAQGENKKLRDQFDTLRLKFDEDCRALDEPNRGVFG